MSDTVTGAAHTAGEFVREERYIVIKRKHLNPEHEAAIRKRCRLWGVPTVECVVVEDDWPEYETVWKMIEARVTGHAEGDLLGKCLEALRGMLELVPGAGWTDAEYEEKLRKDGGRHPDLVKPYAKRVLAARRILSQAQAREVTR